MKLSELRIGDIITNEKIAKDNNLPVIYYRLEVVIEKYYLFYGCIQSSDNQITYDKTWSKDKWENNSNKKLKGFKITKIVPIKISELLSK